MNGSDVTATVSTLNRHQTTLPLVLSAVAHQTVPPKQLVIFDDGEFSDLRGVSPYCHLFPLLQSRGIQWFHLPGKRVGQVANHATALEQADTHLVWRLDDDNAPTPDCLKTLLSLMEDPSVGAASGLIHDPRSISPRPPFVTGKISDIFNPFNLAWYSWTGAPEEVDHLYSTFLYRVDAARRAGGYSRSLSPVGHREETMFSHGIKRAGYKLLITPEALTWHFREATGGIRTYTDGSLWDRDEKVFLAKLSEWGVTSRPYLFMVMDNGIGDHFMLKGMLPGILANHQGKRVIIANCYPDVFKDVPNVEMASIADAKTALGDLRRFDAYRYADDHQWKRPFQEVFLEIYK